MNWKNQFGGQFSVLLVIQFLFMALTPIIVDGAGGKILISLAATFLLSASVYSVNPNRNTFRLAVGIMLSDIVLNILSSSQTSSVVCLIQILCWLITLIYVFFKLVCHVFNAKRVNTDMLMAGICGYIMLGLLWVFIHGLVDFVAPAQYHFEREAGPVWGNLALRRQEFLSLYILSYSTLTNSGAAGMAPHGPYARIFLCIEAMSGQLFLAVLVSRLVGLHSTQALEERKGESEATEV